MEDVKLVKLLKKNPTKGLSQAIDIYGALVKTIVMRIIGYENQQDIEECVSDVFVELWKSIENYIVEKGTLKNYIISIARHISINTYNRKIKNNFTLQLEDDIEFKIDLNDELTKSINKKIISDTLNDLPQPDKDIFIRRYYLYESVKDIAFSLNLNPKTVENKLFRGKEKIKQSLINNGIII